MIEVEQLKEISFFKDLKEETLTDLASIASFKEYSDGEILFYEKDIQYEFYYIIKGAVKFYKVDRFDNEIFLYKVDENSIIFDSTRLCDEYAISCYANAEIMEESTLLVFKKEGLKDLMYSDEAFMHSMLNESFKMIRYLQCVVSRDIVFDGTAKVAHMLATDIESFNSLKKHEIAYMLHIQPETLSRILKKLTRNGIISVDNNSICVEDIESLQEIFE